VPCTPSSLKKRPARDIKGAISWFQDERLYDLIVILDDVTSEIYYAQLVEEESTPTLLAGQKEVIEREGVFCAL